MNKFVILLALIAFVTSLSRDVAEERAAFIEFQQYVKGYEKKYSSVQEFMARYQIFKRNVQKMQNSNESYEEGINQFSDMTFNEFRKIYLNLDFSVIKGIKFNKVHVDIKESLPVAFDWREKGCVNAVKDQQSCGSCWAFSTVGNLEGLYHIKYGKLLRFSEQHLVDCDPIDAGCNGGLMENTFKWLIDNGGFMYESDYKYTGRDEICIEDKSKFVGKVASFNILDTTNEQAIKQYLVETGPLAIALNADALMSYRSGILDKTARQCDPAGLNHAVVLVGYGMADKEFWIVRNSWGKSWGESGYFRIALGKGVCGINTYISSAHLE